MVRSMDKALDTDQAHDAVASRSGGARSARGGGNLSMRQLRAFVALARQGSFTAAAQQMHLSQSALSALVRALEADMGVKLADRTTRRVELTAAGHDLLPMAQRLLADADRLAADLHELALTRRGRVRLGATPLLATTLLPPLLASFARARPGLEVRLFDATADQLLARLRDGELDLSLATFERIDADLAAVPLLRDPLVLACPHDHPLVERPQVAWSHLAGQPLVLMRAGSGLRALVDRRFAALGQAPVVAQEVTQVATAVALAGAGLGIAVVPAYALQVDVPGSVPADVVLRPLIEPRVTRVVSLAHMAARTLSPGAQALQAMLLAHLRSPRASSRGAASVRSSRKPSHTA